MRRFRGVRLRIVVCTLTIASGIVDRFYIGQTSGKTSSLVREEGGAVIVELLARMDKRREST